ncbi:hypothetical protein [Floridanema aerugineum]|jgi:hypothetical protein|uniref:Uncharacterized protein n=1 Tax=Floridaenema aerugineum BLCC-F46 TaxID=3153654 RepID=A0ABV4X0X6_9CYAN
MTNHKYPKGINGDDSGTKTGRVSFGSVIKEVNLAYVPKAQNR